MCVLDLFSERWQSTLFQIFFFFLKCRMSDPLTGDSLTRAWRVGGSIHGDVCLVLAFQYSDRSSHNHSAFHFLGSSYLYFCFEIFGVATVISLKVHVELVNWDTAGMFFSLTLCV